MTMVFISNSFPYLSNNDFHVAVESKNRRVVVPDKIFRIQPSLILFRIRDHDGPKRYEIDRFMKHFASIGIVQNTSKGNSGCPLSVTKDPAMFDVVCLCNWPACSLKILHHRRFQEIGIPSV